MTSWDEFKACQENLTCPETAWRRALLKLLENMHQKVVEQGNSIRLLSLDLKGLQCRQADKSDRVCEGGVQSP